MAVEVTRAAPVAPKPPADPQANSHLPRSVRRQIRRSEELQQELQPSETAPATPPDSQTPASPSAGAQPEPAERQGGETADPPPSRGSSPPVAEPPASQPDPPPTSSAPDETLEQRLRSLEGRYRSDMQRSAERVMQLERELATRPTPEALPPETSLLTEAEIQDYGPEFVDLVRRASTEAQRPLLAKIGQLEAELGATGRRIAVSANDQLHAYMSARIPDWQAINNLPEFVDWSRLPDVYSGAIRQSLMQDAWNKGDGPRVEAFFRGFLAEHPALDSLRAPAAPAAQPPAQPNGSPAPAQPRVTLESLAAPGRARSAPPMPADKPVYTQAQILKFYTDVATGRFGGSEADRAAIDGDIILAQHEGRIVMDTRSAARPPTGFSR